MHHLPVFKLHPVWLPVKPPLISGRPLPICHDLLGTPPKIMGGARKWKQQSGS